MGWRGTLRTMGAISRSIERDSRSRQREYEKLQKQQLKLEIFEQARLEVEQHENYLEVITTLQKECSEPVDWSKIKDLPLPVAPTECNQRETNAQNVINNYKPGMFAKLFGIDKSKIVSLNSALIKAIDIDASEYRKSLTTYEQEYTDWKQMHEIAIRILASDCEAYIIAIREMNPFEEISQIGSSITVQPVGKKGLNVTLQVNSDKVIPKESKTLLKSGKVSKKEMTQSKYWQLYQDYVCSAVLRTARELFALLPVEKIIVNAVVNMLNPKNGHMEDAIVLSVLIPRITLQQVNVEFVDPSDAMSNFLKNMNFKKTTGFQEVEPVQESLLTVV